VSAITFRRLETASFTHSAIYLALLLCAFVLGNPEPETFILGLSHGVVWICMSLVCIAAARARVIPFWLAVTVAVLGGLGPFAGSIGFVVAERRRVRRESPAEPISTRYS
jgi:ABC-type Fe3+-siderophore transport system permease subunit